MKGEPGQGSVDRGDDCRATLLDARHLDLGGRGVNRRLGRVDVGCQLRRGWLDRGELRGAGAGPRLAAASWAARAAVRADLALVNALCAAAICASIALESSCAITSRALTRSPSANLREATVPGVPKVRPRTCLAVTDPVRSTPTVIEPRWTVTVFTFWAAVRDSVFAHELTHACQIAVNKFVPGMICNAPGTYDYHKDFGNGEADRLIDKQWTSLTWEDDFTREQQAHIVDDWFGAHCKITDAENKDHYFSNLSELKDFLNSESSMQDVAFQFIIKCRAGIF